MFETVVLSKLLHNKLWDLKAWGQLSGNSLIKTLRFHQPVGFKKPVQNKQPLLSPKKNQSFYSGSLRTVKCQILEINTTKYTHIFNYRASSLDEMLQHSMIKFHISTD